MRFPRLTLPALLLAVALTPAAAAAQGAAKLAPAKPYKAIAVQVPPPVNDPSFDAFRKDLAGIAQRKDRAALARVVVPKGFFWESEGGKGPDPKKSGVDNLAAALGLDSQDGSGWEALAAVAAEPSAAPDSQRKGVLCSPAMPEINDKEFEDLTKATQTDASEWAYVTKPGTEMRAGPQPDAAVVEKLSPTVIRVLLEESPAAAVLGGDALRVVAPDGKTGYVPANSLGSLASDQVCYLRDANGWKIAGVYGGGDQQ
jgi:hypothetical protein